MLVQSCPCLPWHASFLPPTLLQAASSLGLSSSGSSAGCVQFLQERPCGALKLQQTRNSESVIIDISSCTPERAPRIACVHVGVVASEGISSAETFPQSAIFVEMFVELFGMDSESFTTFAELAWSFAGTFGDSRLKILFSAWAKILDGEGISTHCHEAASLMVGSIW